MCVRACVCACVRACVCSMCTQKIIEVLSLCVQFGRRDCSTNHTIQVDNTTTIKILVLGDKGVGKTSVILKYSRNDFDIHNSPTVSP